jgi:AraC-like DNA-binding protein
MANSTLSFALTGVVPPVCDAEAGERYGGPAPVRRYGSAAGIGPASGFAVRKIRSVMAELCSAIRSALEEERSTAEDSLRRAAVIRRRVERAQGLMLSTDAPLSAIALDCGLADQAHLSRLFRRIVGESPRAWRRARLGAPAQCA